VEGRRLDDDAHVLLRLSNGAKGILVCSQVACGEANNLNIRVYGTEGSLEWHQEEPNVLLYKTAGGRIRTMRAGTAGLSDASRSISRTPAGHPEGYLEAFANIYREAFRAIAAEVSGQPRPKDLDFPTIDDGIEGMAFIETAVKSAKRGAKWVKFPSLK